MSCGRGIATWGVTVLAAVLVIGCDSDVQHPAPASELRRHASTSPGTVALTIGGRQVGVAEFEAFWQQNPSLDRDEAIDRFVERDILFEAASDGDHADRPAIAVARKRSMIRQLMAETVERDVPRSEVDDEKVEELLPAVRADARPPTGLRVSHIVVVIPRGETRKKASKKQVEQWYQLGRAWAENIADSLPDQPTTYRLFEAKDEFAEKIPEPLAVSVNSHMRIPVADVAADRLPDGWVDVVASFRDAASSMAAEGRLGVVSKPVRSEVGWHLIVVYDIYPSPDLDEEAVREVARTRVVRQARSDAFSKAMEAWRSSASFRTYPEVIEEAEELK